MEDDEITRLRRQLAEKQRRLKDAENHAAQLKQKLRPTTLMEYIEFCHELVFTKFVVETNKSLTSKGSITNSQNKLCPTRLLPWPDFLEQQRTAHGKLIHVFPSQTNAFQSHAYLHGLGECISMKPIASEKDLERFLHDGVETPVRLIFDRLKTLQEVKNLFDIGDGIVFENHPNAISDTNEEVCQRHTTPPPPRDSASSRLRADQICVYKHNNTGSLERSIAYIVEYKAPHKLTLQHLRLGLRQMDIIDEVVNRPTIPTAQNPEERFQYHADRLVASAVTQTFHYMIEAGLDYSYLTTGEAIVFLHINWADPGTLYYHLAEPSSEVQAHPDSFHYCTADERESAIASLEKWTVDHDAILRSIPATDKPTPQSSAWKPKTYKNKRRAPLPFGESLIAPVVKTRPDTNIPKKTKTPESSDDEPESWVGSSPIASRLRSRVQSRPRERQDCTQQQGASDVQNSSRRQYCTQKCLLGLVRGNPLDQKCPNVTFHQCQRTNNHHPVKYAKWLQLLKQQLRQTLDDGVVRLEKQGARGVLFQVTLLMYGYTFVSKGTVPEFTKDLEHEAMVYRQLQFLQGDSVPVFLGAIDLRDISRTYYYDLRVRITYMMFLSWGGGSLDDTGTAHLMGEDLNQQVVQSVQALHKRGIIHTDVRKPNILWNQENHKVMIVDFERAILTDSQQHSLAPLVSNKRGPARELEAYEAAGKRRLLAKDEVEMSRDIMQARLILHF
ncbi:uncharacterized protein F4822DRAFT_426001 [Hypoxylon trugodes]|uniref:uncharacterized protein n=1 Tax=Hypoxylon trugodes TaxID=326681 RepID=UPI002192F72F|nr:uncharacterized protein F4822DRAFT_426001 [Hypoxylon trugodes]KAI1392793.1 hypothetical protein F4822DRAFT_426001 [Hypoxylon trugodes]